MQYTKSSTKVELAKVLGVTSNLIHTWEKRNSPNIRTIKEAIPQINTNWLLTGEGEMLDEGGNAQLGTNRTKEIIYAIMQYKGIVRKSHLASMLGISKGNLCSMEVRDSYRPLIKKVKEAFPEINEYWLITGKGEMVEQPCSQQEQISSIRIIDDANATTPMVIPTFNDCTDAVTLYGDSMYPLIKSGDMVLLREWREEYIEYGSVYLIVTNSGNRMVKYVRTSEREGYIRCVSENKHFESFEVKREDIVRMFAVKGVISRIIF